MTGTPGVGKSAVCDVLNSRGFEAYDADTGGFRYWQRRDTGEIVASPGRPLPPGWHLDHEMPMDRAAVEALAERASGTVFLCGTVGNEAEVWHLFSRVICLVVDQETLRYRLANRPHGFGKEPELAAQVLVWNLTSEERYRGLGATIVDSTRPLEKVADEVIAAAGIAI